jgi:lysophospholipase L1-like esterase
MQRTAAAVRLRLVGSWTGGALVACLSAAPADAQTVDGTLFHDLDRDGVRDPGEPALAGVPVTLFGADGGFDQTIATATDGRYSFIVTNGLKYVLEAVPGSDWRLAFQDLGADPDPIPDRPQGRRRPGLADFLVGHLRASTPGAPLLHVALGDSIAYGFNLCDSTGGKNDYVRPLTTDKLDRAGSAAISKQAVLGYETRDLLDPGGSGTIFDAIALAPQLVTISIGGNDFLSDDGNHARTAANLIAARQNLQELLSTLLTELPDCDVILNTVYDNEGGADAFHNEWGVVWDQVLRDVAWGQRRRVAIAEVWPDYEHEDPASGALLGEDDLICQFFGLDAIHPKKRGYDLHEEKVWQGLGGVTATSGAETRNFGFLRRLGSRFATVATTSAAARARSPTRLRRTMSGPSCRPATAK